LAGKCSCKGVGEATAEQKHVANNLHNFVFHGDEQNKHRIKKTTKGVRI